MPRFAQATVLVIIVAGCGPSAELEDLRRRTNDAATRFDERLSAEGQRVDQAADAAEEVATVEARAQRALDVVLNDADSTLRDREAAGRTVAEARRDVEEAVSRVEVVIAERDAALDAELAGWRPLYEQCVALEDDESETGGCGPIPPDR